MRPSTLWTLARSGRLRTFRSLTSISAPFYRACFLLGAAKSGVLRRLAERPASAELLASHLKIPDAHRDGLQEWLEVGRSLGELDHGPAGYSLSGQMAKALVEQDNDDVLALLEEMIDLHRRLLLDTPTRLAKDDPFALDDHDPSVVARSSRMLELFVQEAIEDVVPREGAVRLLEIGCGSGTHIRHAAGLNPELTARGLELSPEVAEMARANMKRWGLAERVQIELGDVRDETPEPEADLVTLHNNIYYFPVDERVSLLRQVHGFLRPGGKLLLTTGCRGGSTTMAVLSLWGAATTGCSPLPDEDQLVAELREAGFSEVSAKNLLAPVDRFFAFEATR